MAKNVVVMLTDHLQAIGLKALLLDCFGAQVAELDPHQEHPDSNADLYVTQPDVMVSQLGFFMPRKDKTVLLADSEVVKGWHTIDPQQDVDAQIGAFDKLLNSHQDEGGSLSQREIDVLRLVAQGHINKEISNELNISVNTVLTHRKNISAKLGIKSVSGLCVYALMNGIIEP